MNQPLVVHVITNFAGVGGAEMMLARLIQQTQHQYQHIIIALMQTSEVYTDTLALCREHYALNWNGINSLSVVAKLKKILLNIQPQFIQGWMYHANALTSLSLVAVKNKPPFFWGIHHSLASPKTESVSTKIALQLSKVLSKQPTGIIYCAHSAQKQHQQFGFQNHNQQVIANGVYLDQFQQQSQLNTPTVIGFAGRYHTAKGYAYLLQVMAELKDQPIIFKIAGSGANLDNPEISAYFADGRLNAAQVHLLDQVNDMPAFYQSIDAFLMASITEGFPNVLVEAMASGVPCISTDVGDAKYIVQDLGWVVPPRDVQALRTAILTYMQLDPATKLELKQHTRARVQAHFSIETVSQKYIAAWESAR